MSEPLAQWLRAAIRESATDPAETVCKTLAPWVTDGAVARQWLSGRIADMALAQPQLPAGFADPVCRSLVVFDDQRVHLSLAIVSAEAWNAQNHARREGRPIVGFADGWTAIRFLAAAGVQIQRFRLERTRDEFELGSTPPGAVQPGELVYLDNAREAQRFTNLETDVVMARLLVRDPDVQQAVECDVRAGSVLRIREAQSYHGRIRMLVSLLRSLERRDAVPAIAQAMASWPAHLRWHGVREALATDSMTGFGLLQQVAQSDPDGDLQRLARQTRDRLLTRHPQLAA